jgi:hypothetical protein
MLSIRSHFRLGVDGGHKNVYAMHKTETMFGSNLQQKMADGVERANLSIKITGWAEALKKERKIRGEIFFCYCTIAFASLPWCTINLWL